MSRNTASAIIGANRSIKYGLRKHHDGETFVLNGEKWSVAKLIGALDAEDAQFRTAKRARGVWLLEVAQLRKRIRTNHVLRLAIRAFVELRHGSASEALRDYGFKPRKRKKPSIETMRRAVEKRRATRAARGTMGPRQRKKIKGVMPAEAQPK
jgi:hypothetical protein